jgi:hypothetical protein
MKQDRINEYIKHGLPAMVDDGMPFNRASHPAMNIWARSCGWVPRSTNSGSATVSPSRSIYVFGIRGEGKSATHRATALMARTRFDAKTIHTHTFPLAQVPTAIKRIEDAIKVVVKIRES